MSPRPDELPRALSNPQDKTRDRLHYTEGRLLRAADLADEQLYHRGRLAHALRLLHGCGTVAGLRVVHSFDAATKSERLTVGAGLALDCFGRMIEVPQDFALDLARWYADQGSTRRLAAYRTAPPPFTDGAGVVADVLLRFACVPRGVTPTFVSGNTDATDAFAPARMRDGFELSLSLATADPLRALPAVSTPGPQAAPALNIEDVFDAWERLPRLPDDRDGLVAGNDELPSIERDPSTLFLARLCFPTGTTDHESRTCRTDGTVEPPRIRQDVRRFVYAPGILSLATGP